MNKWIPENQFVPSTSMIFLFFVFLLIFPRLSSHVSLLLLCFQTLPSLLTVNPMNDDFSFVMDLTGFLSSLAFAEHSLTVTLAVHLYYISTASSYLCIDLFIAVFVQWPFLNREVVSDSKYLVPVPIYTSKCFPNHAQIPF